MMRCNQRRATEFTEQDLLRLWKLYDKVITDQHAENKLRSSYK